MARSKAHPTKAICRRCRRSIERSRSVGRFQDDSDARRIDTLLVGGRIGVQTYHVRLGLAMVPAKAILGAAGLEVGGESVLDARGHCDRVVKRKGKGRV